MQATFGAYSGTGQDEDASNVSHATDLKPVANVRYGWKADLTVHFPSLLLWRERFKAHSE